MGSNPISSGTEVKRAGEITWEKEPLGGVQSLGGSRLLSMVGGLGGKELLESLTNKRKSLSILLFLV